MRGDGVEEPGRAGTAVAPGRYETGPAGHRAGPSAGPPRRVVLADALTPEATELLAGTPGLEVVDRVGRPREALEEALATADGLVVRSGTTVDRSLLEAAPVLRVVGRAGVGVDNIDVAEATRRGIAVLNAPGGNTVSTAELTFGLLLAAARRIPRADREVREGRWDRKALRGMQLQGRRLGVVGLGRIGTAVAARARAFGMEVVAHDPYAPEGRAAELGVEMLELDVLLESSDFVTLHVPLTDATRGLLNARRLARMRPGACLVNAARGGLVDEEALARALREGRLRAAALDVYAEEPLPEESPLRDVPDLVLTPHLGAATEEARRGVSMEIARAVRDALLEGDLRAALNAPRVDPARRAEVEPLLELARQLGHLLHALLEGSAAAFGVRYAGPHEEILRAVTSAALEGFLAPTTDRPVNAVNAFHLAAERGIEVSRVRAAETGDYANYLELTARPGTERAGPADPEGDGPSRIVGGALLAEGHPRLVRIDGYHVDTVPRGILLVIRNRDVPGVIGEVGTRLGSAGVNIAEYHQARRAAGGEALAVVTVDEPVPASLLAEIGALESVRSVRQVVFGRA